MRKKINRESNFYLMSFGNLKIKVTLKKERDEEHRNIVPFVFILHNALQIENSLQKNLLQENTACMTFTFNGVQSTRKYKNTSVCIREVKLYWCYMKGFIYLFIHNIISLWLQNKNPKNKTKYSCLFETNLIKPIIISQVLKSRKYSIWQFLQ